MTATTIALTVVFGWFAAVAVIVALCASRRLADAEAEAKQAMRERDAARRELHATCFFADAVIETAGQIIYNETQP